MKSKVLVRGLFTLMLAASALFTVTAQDVNKAIEDFNKALELQTSDPEAAIASLKSCLDMCDQVGEDADDVKARAELKLPELYFFAGNKLVKDKKITAAIPAYKEAIAVAQKYQTPEIEQKAKNMLPQLYNAVGGGHYKKDEFDAALEALTKAIEVDPDYARAYYTMGLVYKKQDKLVEFEETMDKGLQASINSRDNAYKNRITSAGATTFLSIGAQSLTDGNAAGAVENLEKALKYDQENPDIYFYLATANNELKQWDKAIDAANKGLSVEKDDPDQKAKHFYCLGLAYKGKGDTDSACSALQNALYGQFKDNAQYEIDVTLKCK